MVEKSIKQRCVSSADVMPVRNKYQHESKRIYKRRVQAEIDSYKDSEDEDKRDTIQSQDILMIDRISI